MKRWRALLLAVAPAVLMLAACAPPADEGEEEFRFNESAQDGDSDVASKELRALKAEAGIEDCPATGDWADDEGGQLPSVDLDCLGGGRAVLLEALRGEPLVLNVWASNCDPCKDEMPLMQRLHESGDVRVLGVDFEDANPKGALELAKDSGVTYPSVADPTGELKAPLPVAGLPTTVFVDDRGKVAATLPKAYDSYDDLTADVEEHLGVEVS